jgi:hypothetical protein
VLNWFQAKVETFVKDFIEKKVYQEVQCAFDSLMLLATYLHDVEAKYRKTVMDKRVAWTDEMSSQPIEEGSVAAALLKYQWAVQPSPEEQIILLQCVAVAISNERSVMAPLEPPERMHEIRIVGDTNVDKIADWCVEEIKGSLSDIDVVVAKVRQMPVQNHVANQMKLQAVDR